jgi:hypothetical protein
LPLLIANQQGWFILNTHRVRCVWNGGPRMEHLIVIDKGGPPGTPCPAISHFGHGVLTWNLNYLFRTPPGYNLWARGPANQPKDGAAALEGIIETDWSVATFTMNWKMTAIGGAIDFVPGEPICQISPVRRGEVETFHPSVADIDTQPRPDRSRTARREQPPVDLAALEIEVARTGIELEDVDDDARSASRQGMPLVGAWGDDTLDCPEARVGRRPVTRRGHVTTYRFVGRQKARLSNL